MIRIINADVFAGLAALDAASVHCVVTSPPYWGLRDYGAAGQIGLEPSPAEYVATMVRVFDAIARVMRKDGTCWLNLGDSYAGGGHGGKWRQGNADKNKGNSNRDGLGGVSHCKPKDLVGIPWRVAFALQAAGWYLRQDIIWAKPNPMPESVNDRCTKAHEYLFLLTRSQRYFYDAEAIAEPVVESSIARIAQDIDGQAGSTRANGGTRAERPMKAVFRAGPGVGGWSKGADHSPIAHNAAGGKGKTHYSDNKRMINGRQVLTGVKNADRHPSGGWCETIKRNKRSVWEIPSAPFAEAHFATFPPELPALCIKAGCPPGGTVLDPFGGAGTTGLVADRLGRNAILIELNPDYVALAERRIKDDCPLFTELAP